jgi:hypothetical protein
VLLQSEDELLVKHTSELASEGVAPKPKKIIGKLRVQGRLLISALAFLLFKCLVRGLPKILLIVQCAK